MERGMHTKVLRWGVLRPAVCKPRLTPRRGLWRVGGPEMPLRRRPHLDWVPREMQGLRIRHGRHAAQAMRQWLAWPIQPTHDRHQSEQYPLWEIMCATKLHKTSHETTPANHCRQRPKLDQGSEQRLAPLTRPTCRLCALHNIRPALAVQRKGSPRSRFGAASVSHAQRCLRPPRPNRLGEPFGDPLASPTAL